MTILVYGIPNCGTCKKAIAWLEENQVEYQFINTKENPPNESMLTGWVKSLGVKSMRNTSGLSYRALGEEKKTWTDEQWVKAFSNDPMLIKRPLFVKNDEAVLVGFRANEEVKQAKLCS